MKARAEPRHAPRRSNRRTFADWQWRGEASAARAQLDLRLVTAIRRVSAGARPQCRREAPPLELAVPDRLSIKGAFWSRPRVCQHWNATRC